MKKALKQLPTYAKRTYRGGKLLRSFLYEENASDDFYPEDWITSFTEAKNREYVKNEGISRVITESGEMLITEAVKNEDFGEGRADSGVLIKLLDAAERLGIQVHPTKAYAKKYFNSDYGKTECWYVLGTREDSDEKACIYLGFKEYVTKELWKELFEKQDVNGMLAAMHRFEVKAGDVILVTGGTPHAIGAGCFLLEIQEPSDYTMRVEKTTVAGEQLTPKQIHYGVGEEAMLDCFEMLPMSENGIKERFFLKGSVGENGEIRLVTYDDTVCFALSLVDGGHYRAQEKSFVTVVALDNGGTLKVNGDSYDLRRGDRFFVPAGSETELKDAKAVICYPPKKEN